MASYTLRRREAVPLLYRKARATYGVSRFGALWIAFTRGLLTSKKTRTVEVER